MAREIGADHGATFAVGQDSDMKSFLSNSTTVTPGLRGEMELLLYCTLGVERGGGGGDGVAAESAAGPNALKVGVGITDEGRDEHG